MSARTPLTTVPRRLLVVRDLVAIVAVTGVAYGVALAHRTDYLGHYFAGFGGTLLLLVVPLAFVHHARWSIVATVVAAIALGWGTEATIHRLAIFDPVDFANQSLGAALAGMTVMGRPRSVLAAVAASIIAVGLLWAGFHYAFV